MGRVYLVSDSVLQRSVALKEAGTGGEAAERLKQEARLTAGLEHPSIVTVHDVGVTEEGRSYYTMRLVRGRALSDLLQERPNEKTRIRLLRHFLAACQAMAYAHSMGVIHRDIKPANLMIGAFGETQVLDWGLACHRDGPFEGGSVGTPAYMSPETAEGAAPDPRVDVWGLGAVLYELLCGDPPWGTGPPDELMKRARQRRLPRLQVRASWIAPDLAAIADRALAVNPAERYPDAGALADDVAAWLDGRPVGAYQYTRGELLGRAARAWRGPLVVGAIATVALGVLAGLAVHELSNERSAAIRSEAVAHSALQEAAEQLSNTLAAQARAADAEGARPLAEVLAAGALMRAESPEARGVLAGSLLQPTPTLTEVWALPDCRVIAVLGLDDFLCGTSAEVRRVTEDRVRWTVPTSTLDLAHSEDSLLLRQTSAAQIVDLDSGAVRRRLDCCWNALILSGSMGLEPLQNTITPYFLSEDGYRGDWPPCGPTRRVMVSTFFPRSEEILSFCEDGQLRRGRYGEQPHWSSGVRLEGLLVQHAILMEVNPDATAVVVAGTKGRLVRVDLATEAVIERQPTQSDLPRVLAFSGDGAFLAVLGERGVVRIYCGFSLQPIGVLPLRGVRDIRFQGDGILLAVTGDEGSAWQLTRKRNTAVLRARHGVTGIAFSPDGALLASSHGSGEVHVWDPRSGEVRADLDVGLGTVKSIDFDQGGQAVLFSHIFNADAGQESAIYRATLDAPVERLLAHPARRVVTLAGDLVFLAGWDGRFVLKGARLEQDVSAEGCPQTVYKSASSAPGGEHAVMVTMDGSIVPFHTTPPRCEPPIRGLDASSADILQDGTRLAVGVANAVMMMDDRGNVLWRAAHPLPGPLDVALSPDGRWLAAGGADHHARIWDARTGELRARLAGHNERVAAVEFSPDGRLLVSGSWDATLRLWGLEALEVNPEQVLERARATWDLDVPEALRLMAL